MSWVRGRLKVRFWAVRGGRRRYLRLDGRLEAGVKIHKDVVPAPGFAEAGGDKVVELEAGEPLSGAGGAEGVFLNVGDSFVVRDTVREVVAETDFRADF